MLAIFSLNVMCNGMMYSTEAAVTEIAVEYYNIKAEAVYQLTDIFYAGAPSTQSAHNLMPWRSVMVGVSFVLRSICRFFPNHCPRRIPPDPT